MSLPRSPVGSLLIKALPLLVMGLAAPALAQSLPDPNDQPQVTAEPPVRVPNTARCDEVVLENKFDGFYLPNPNPAENPDDRGGVRYGEHKASACPGPWSKVVLNVDVYVDDGIQYDRVFEIYIRNAPLLSSSTSEGVGEGTKVHWHVETDVSQFANWLKSDQPITGILNNAHWDGYFGIFNVKLTLSFYAADADNPKIDAPDYIGVIYPQGPDGRPHPDTHGYSGYGGFDFNSEAPEVSLPLSDLPRNLVSLVADLRAQGHGPNEEFWWGDGKRQVELLIDGQVAGFAPLYPVLFTGANGPGNWMPIPSPRAYHLDPYRVDLTPFVGRLVDGKPHTFTLRIPDSTLQDGDYWMAGATLFGETDPASPMQQTQGELLAAIVDEAAIESSPTGVDYAAERSGTWKGYVISSAGRVETIVSNRFEFSTPQALLAYDNRWNWVTRSGRATEDNIQTITTVDREYTLQGTLGVAGVVPSAITLGDAATTTVQGPDPFSEPFVSSFSLQMTTSGIGLASNISQVETYCGQDSTGWAWSRTITAQGGFVTSDGDGVAVCGYSSSEGAAPAGGAAAPAAERAAGGKFGGALLPLNLLSLGVLLLFRGTRHRL